MFAPHLERRHLLLARSGATDRRVELAFQLRELAVRVGRQRLHFGVFARLRIERGAVIAEQPVLALAVLFELAAHIRGGEKGKGKGERDK